MSCDQLRGLKVLDRENPRKRMEVSELPVGKLALSEAANGNLARQRLGAQ